MSIKVGDEVVLLSWARALAGATPVREHVGTTVKVEGFATFLSGTVPVPFVEYLSGSVMYVWPLSKVEKLP